MKTKEDFKHSKKWLENRLKNNKPLCKWNRGYLEALEDYENLILFGVNRSLPTSTEPFALVTKQIVENADRVIDFIKVTKGITTPEDFVNRHGE